MTGSQSIKLRVMSYNLLADNSEGGYPWGTPLGERPIAATKCMRDLLPDVAGLQEVTVAWYSEIRRALPEYAFINTLDPQTNTPDGICTALMYNTETLSLEKTELIHYKDSYWGIGRVRYINMGLFKHKESGLRFIMICTHFDAGQEDPRFEECRISQAKELTEKLKEYRSAYGCPIISVADYNCGVLSAPYKHILDNAPFFDTNESCPPEMIDHILCSKDITPMTFRIIDGDDIRHASDHLPIYAEVKIN